MLETAYPPSKSIKKQYFFLFWQVSGPKESQMNAKLQNLFHKKKFPILFTSGPIY